MEKLDFVIKPLGGVGQIGSNMTLIQTKSERIVIDCGILFPYEDYFDINYLIPNLEKEAPFDAIVFTHGHEDHIGAVTHFIKHSPNAKIFAGDFTAALIRKKLDFAKLTYPISVYNYTESITFNEIIIDPIHVNHSIPETMGLLIRDLKDKFAVFFASDFKIDFRSPYEKPFDFKKLKDLSKKAQKRVFLADSTNIMSGNLETPSEADIIPNLEEVFKNLENRIFITCFSSNIHRLKTIINLCEKYEFKFVPHGRSVVSYLNIAREKGMIDNFDKVVRLPEQITRDQKNLCVLLSGCQGDHLGTLRRVAINEDSTFKLKKTDTVLFSSKAIPGNEKKIGIIMNRISDLGANIINDSKKIFHVSGHPGKSDLLKIYSEFSPDIIIPIHGETLFLKEHCEFINKSFPQAKSIYVDNFDSIHFLNDLDIRAFPDEALDPVIIHGKDIPIEREKISERRKISCNGGVFLSLEMNSKIKKIAHFELSTLGLPNVYHHNHEAFNSFLTSFFEANKVNDIDKFKEEVRIAVRRYFDNILGYKPTTMIHLNQK